MILALVSITSAQEGKPDAAEASADSAASQEKGAPEADPLKRPLTEKQKKQNSKSLKIELSKTYKKWLDEDVRWIISDEEQKAFKLLSNDEERDQFIEAFWQRRDPTSHDPARDNGGQDLAAHVGHTVVVHGSYAGAAGAPGTATSTAGAGDQFTVSRIDMVSETCSADKAKDKTAQPQ
jgi:hypothetical protein